VNAGDIRKMGNKATLIQESAGSEVIVRAWGLSPS